ncbi:MAG: hypothetical protein ACRDTC_19630 [Pseudonocardiaceae bacterium]
MTDPRLDELTAEARRARIGPLWLAEVRRACREVSRRFDAAIYAVVERSWTSSEIEELVQDVTVEQLLRQGQLRYLLDVAASVDDVRRLLRHQVRRALVRRRRRTVVDQLLIRIKRFLEGPGWERLPGVGADRWRPSGSEWSAQPPTESGLRSAVAAVRMLPKSLGTGEHAPAVYRSEMLSRLIDLAFTAAGTSLSIDDFGTILREVLTSWVPVVLDHSEEPDVPGAESADLALDLEETVTAVLDALNDTDRTVLRIKLAGAPDSELATALRVSRPTAAKRKSETFGRLRAAWVRAGAPGASESIRLAEELYVRLHTAGGSDV